MKTISCPIRKGGQGKSTTVQTLAAIYGKGDKRVLVVDFDSQRNTSYSSGVIQADRSITDVLGRDCKAEEAIVQCKYYSLLPSDDYLSNVELSVPEQSIQEQLRQGVIASGVSLVSMTLLKECLSDLNDRYDFCFIDVPPSFGTLSYMALVASDYVVIPVEANTYGMTGLYDLAKTLESVKRSYNPSLEVAGVYLNKYNPRTRLSVDVKDMLHDYCNKSGIYMFNTTVRQSTVVEQAQLLQIPLVDHAPKSKVMEDYIELAKELEERIQK